MPSFISVLFSFLINRAICYQMGWKNCTFIVRCNKQLVAPDFDSLIKWFEDWSRKNWRQRIHNHFLL